MSLQRGARRPGLLAALTLVSAPAAEVVPAAVASQDPAPEAALEAADRPVFLVPVAAEPGWRDDAFLAAVAAAAQLNGEPMVLAVDPVDPWRPELLDFLRRYEASELWCLGEPLIGAPSGLALRSLPCGSAEEAALVLAAACWQEADPAVLYDPGDRAAALSASVLAARLQAPLFPCPGGALGVAVRQELERLGAGRVLLVSPTAGDGFEGLRRIHLANAEEVTAWMVKHRLPVDYLAAVNPGDAALSPGRRLSLAAAVLAAGRGGAVAPLAYDTRWKLAFPAPDVLEEAPPGTHASGVPLRRGLLEHAGESLAFVTGRDPADGRWWAQLDRDGDGAYDGPDEQPVGTGDALAVAGRRWRVDLDADEKARGQSLWLSSPTPEEVRADLGRSFRAAGGAPSALCLVGWPDALPLAVIGPGQGIDGDLASDLPYGQTDADPFVELAYARFVAEDLASATLQACRGLAYDDFRDRSWEHRFATAEWEGVCRETFQGAGYQFAGHHDGAAPIAAGSPLTEAGLIVHASHAMWTVMGETYAWDTPTLLAPAVVESAGCSTAALDQDAEHRSVAARLLRNGAVAFLGNSRRGIAQQDLFRSEVWNALLAGQSLGEANRAALNRLTVAVLEKDENGHGPYTYQLYNHAVYGDPALRLTPPGEPADRPAWLERRGNTATIRAPSRWTRFEYAPLAEWGAEAERLYSWRGAGMSTENWWFHPERRNAEALYFTAALRTRRELSEVEPVDPPPPPLGWTGQSFVDEHADGSRTLYWRARLIDFDMTSGEIRAEVDQLRFRLK